MADYPTYGTERVSIDTIIASRTFQGMHGDLQTRVRNVIEASAGNVGLGQGLRDSKQQLQLFLSRHVPDPAGKYTYDAKRWSRIVGVAAAAPPGASMHEIGLAADLTGDMRWLRENVARFDLQTFEDVNDEPWHVQPTELPRSRSSYEKQPIWGLPPWDGSSVLTVPAGSPTITSPTPLSTAPLSPALHARPGDTGPAVVVLLEALIARGLLANSPANRSGVYGPEATALVEEFQRTSGLQVDGIVGPQTWGALLIAVTPGDTGAHVVVLQATLIVRGLIHDTAGNHDGNYGGATQNVIRQFQTLAGLGADASVGPKTWAALIGAKSPHSTTRGGTRGGPSAEVDLDDLDLLAVYEGLPAE